MANSTPRPIVLADLGREPFRILFPSAVLAGMLGAMVWPLHFAGWGGYPAVTHARLMTAGFFGGFIFGFLGTALPRMLSAPPLGVRNVLLLTALHLAAVIAFATGQLALGDHIFLVMVLTFALLMALRFRQRKDLPPPGFVLAGLGFLCAAGGAVLAVLHCYFEDTEGSRVFLQRLCSYQGFVLLPLLGVGPFLLPRFFGQASTGDCRLFLPGGLGLAAIGLRRSVRSHGGLPWPGIPVAPGAGPWARPGLGTPDCVFGTHGRLVDPGGVSYLSGSPVALGIDRRIRRGHRGGGCLGGPWP